MKKVRFGIIGTGMIGKIFAADGGLVPSCEVVAVTSRAYESGKAFADTYQIPKVYTDYEAMLADPEIDAVYIATPHVNHKADTLAALRAKKAVLCEKPFAMNAADTEEMIQCAQEEGVLLMEAMWTRFLPAIQKMKSLLDAGAIGEVNFVKCDFGFAVPTDYPETGRLLNPELGGGALYDVGIYPVATTRLVMGEDPKTIQCAVMKARTGVDGLSSYQCQYEDGRIALLYSAVTVDTQRELFISGTKGTLLVPHFWMADQVIVTLLSGETQTYDFPKIGSGYVYEIESFCESYLNNKLENEWMPHSETLAIMKTMDRIIAQIK